jgi:phytoene/squalene synthetase
MSSAHDASLLAHAADLTRRGSLHTYLVIRCMVDRDLVEGGFRAYAYFRWLDDVLDLQLGERQQRLAMVKEQAELARRALAGDFPRPACAEEQLVQDLIRGHRSGHPGLISYVNCMMQVMAFDAGRRGRLVSAAELEDYSRLLATAVMDGLTYFIGHDQAYPVSAARYSAVAGPHISHMLRDAVDDLHAGYFNIPREVLEADNLSPGDINAPAYRRWVRGRVALAEALFRDGKRYIRSVPNLRARLSGLAYCASFESVLIRVKRNGYSLREPGMGEAPHVAEGRSCPVPAAAVHGPRQSSPVADA